MGGGKERVAKQVASRISGSLLRTGRLWRRGGKDREAEVALAVLLEQLRHRDARQHTDVAVAAPPFVLYLLPRPGLPLV
ncbi:MAG: hypothetical protein MK133_10405, partial [Planctomycetes bacterium]|nr:hypothetical protein [Planctomycetota bacterium]